MQKEDRAQKRCNQAGWAGIVRVWFIDELKLSMIREEKRRAQKGAERVDEPLMFWKF